MQDSKAVLQLVGSLRGSVSDRSGLDGDFRYRRGVLRLHVELREQLAEGPIFDVAVVEVLVSLLAPDGLEAKLLHHVPVQ